MVFSSIIWNINSEILKIGKVSINWYGFLIAIGFIISYLILRNLLSEKEIFLKTYNRLIIYLFIGAIIGARIFHLVFYNLGNAFNNPLNNFLPVIYNPSGKIENFGFHGLASHGAAIGMFISLLLFSYKNKTHFLWLLDRIVIVAALGFVFVRLGNFMHSEIYGIETNLPWGVIFVNNNEIVPRHPTQLYEAFSYLIIFVFLIGILRKKESIRNGIILGLFLMSIFSSRFLIEFLRANRDYFLGELSLNMGQLLSIPFIIIGILVIMIKYIDAFYKKNLHELQNCEN